VRRQQGATLAELERVYRAQFRAFLRTATAYLGEADVACDAVQEAVATAIRKRRTYRGTGTVEAWVWSVVLNTIRSRYRARSHDVLLDHELRDHGAPATPNRDGSTEIVRAAVRRLPERERLVLFLRYYADLDYGTIAERLGMSDGTVGASLNAARTTLRGLLQEVRR
jgi:RNA polymerase sigma factor (sigma-70 family)